LHLVTRNLILVSSYCALIWLLLLINLIVWLSPCTFAFPLIGQRNILTTIIHHRSLCLLSSTWCQYIRWLLYSIIQICQNILIFRSEILAVSHFIVLFLTFNFLRWLTLCRMLIVVVQTGSWKMFSWGLISLLFRPWLFSIHKLVFNKLAITVYNSTSDIGIILHFDFIIYVVRHVFIWLLVSSSRFFIWIQHLILFFSLICSWLAIPIQIGLLRMTRIQSLLTPAILCRSSNLYLRIVIHSCVCSTQSSSC